ncbi:hypothetical protein TARUN_2461 [Trichoderma arundinaceum]|uniref:Uncharacterized protein n=1 Tax=Trichoderma arundinaceum TaxID=490622 RepID=A0A395NUL7_TRIAR|nr:hypothetical protein TARUN_2461 [Trichoderma arundinaceum]
MSSDRSPSTAPFIYVVIPLLAIFFVCSTGLIIHVRRRRRRANTADRSLWARGRWVTRDGVLIYIPGHHRRNPSGGNHSQEGLNELGEAPPPYEVKKLPEGTDDATEGPTQLRDMEEGRRPPEYITEPPPAVTTDSRRTGVA